MSQQEFPGLVPANPLNAPVGTMLSRKTDRHGYRTVYRTDPKTGKKKKLGSVGNAAGLRWLMAFSR